jgi:DNA-binding NtrC family response regulator
VEAAEATYDRALILFTAETRDSTAPLVEALGARIAAVEGREVEVADPSDYRLLFEATRGLLATLPKGPIDVVLSAGTPQAQAVWVLLVQAELLPARMLQVIPPAFVPVPHPHPVRVVRLDFAGFPEIRALREEVVRLRGQAGPADGLIGLSAPMALLRARMAAVAKSEVPVLILGETGTGKELVARALHAAGPRRAGPFVAENCGAFAEGVLQSELFGHERGAFTGAAGRRRGLFEQADGGTLLLDEVGELSLMTQASLLRVLQEGTLRRVGGERPVRVDVRLLAATHRDLPALVREGRFREDLYYRLRGASLELPPLRARGADLEALVAHFLGASRLRLTPAAWAALRAWRWPGNVRELRAEVQRWTVFCVDRVGLEDLSPELRGPTPELRSPVATLAPSASSSLAAAVAAAEQAAIAAAMAETGGNLSQAARLLEIDRNTLKRKLPGGRPGAAGAGRSTS